ncbi:MAG: phosphatidylglycerol lysyltransferase domain-containing protein [Thermodesulfobacteriota bacterium]
MPFNFTTLSLNLKAEIEALLQQYPPQISEMTFTNLFMWRCYYQFQVDVDRDFLTLLAHPAGTNPYFFPPLGNGDPDHWLADCLEYFRERGIKPRFERFPESLIKTLPFFPELEFIPDRDNSDYVYPVKNMIRLSGNKYHTPKNHLNRFTKRHVWDYQPLTPDLIKDCLGVQEEWCRLKQCLDSHSLINEHQAILEALTHFGLLSYKGGVIRVQGKVEAFTLGELLNPETVVIHIEKTNPELPGLNPLLQQQFLLHEWSHLPYVNREQDMGLEGLRKSKLSYHPEFLVDKYRLVPA